MLVKNFLVEIRKFNKIQKQYGRVFGKQGTLLYIIRYFERIRYNRIELASLVLIRI